MPTASKLSAALLFAALAYLASLVGLRLLHGELPAGRIPEINAGIGLLIGWFFVGRRVGGGLRMGASNGLTATILGLALVLVLHGLLHVLRLSMRLNLRDPMEAVETLIEFTVLNAVKLATPSMAMLLILGGALIGTMVELVSRRAS
ncbi:TrgA family protein [Limimaricola pyoseonensis]|uniref:Tellurium resistance protein n=1 Tax=Limimaricola pyoseonensis TaxID=521013 RepID=A0A1G7GTJ2_9RHOB|nr:TrgA family protein [Limimaricola pyoseonensis]SDE91455.1 hypothetical protein SAMN04488567_2920 [Limimaricola pyoseonensis]